MSLQANAPKKDLTDIYFASIIHCIHLPCSELELFKRVNKIDILLNHESEKLLIRMENLHIGDKRLTHLVKWLNLINPIPGGILS